MSLLALLVTDTSQADADAVDSGFDLMRLVDPGPVDAGSVEVRVGGAVLAAQVTLEGDALLLALPQRIKQDSVKVSFTTRVLRNAQVFSLDLGLSERLGLWQSVEPTDRRANQVFLPDLVASDALIGNLQIAPAIFTPNGDGLNDAVAIRFVVFKMTTTQPRVRLFDLAGQQIVELQQPQGGNERLYTWSGEDGKGGLVPPAPICVTSTWAPKPAITPRCVRSRSPTAPFYNAL